MRNEAWEARQITINKAAELIVSRHSGADAAQVLRFVETQFNAWANDPNVRITVELLAQDYDNALARQAGGDGRVQMRIAKVLFKCLIGKPQHQAVQWFELAAAFQTQTQESLQKYLPELEAVLDTLVEREFISLATKPSGGQPRFNQGVDFDVWVKQMTEDEEKKASVVNHYNLSGANARVNLHSTDNSTNTSIVGDGSNIQNELASLRQEIKAAADLAETDRADALEQVDAIEAQFASGNPKKSIVSTLLNALPKVGSVASIASAIHAWWPK